MAVTWKKLAKEDDVLLKSVFEAHSLVIAVSDDTPIVLELAASRMVGRASSGNIVALAKADILTIINVTEGADVTGSNAPQAHAASHKNGQSDEILLHELGEPTSAVAIDGQQLTDHVLHTVADAAALAGLTPVVGKMAWQTDELAVYVCTVAA